MALAGCQTDFVKPLENDSEAPAPVRDVTYVKMRVLYFLHIHCLQIPIYSM